VTAGRVTITGDPVLLGNIIRDSGDTARITTAIALPHVTLTGNVRVSDTLGVGWAPTTNYGIVVVISAASAAGVLAGNFNATNTNTSGVRNVFGLYGGAFTGATGSGTNQGFGLYFAATHQGANLCNVLETIHTTLFSLPGSGAITLARGIYLYAASWAGTLPTTVYGIQIDEQGGAGVTTAYGLRISNQTATTVYLLEIGTTPYLRLVGTAAPGAGLTNLWLYEGTTPQLRNVGFTVADGTGHVPAAAKVLYLV
jgi:hypothetical protein